MQCCGELRALAWIIWPAAAAAICWLTAQLLCDSPLAGMPP